MVIVGVLMETVYAATFEGVITDNKLTWKPHLKYTILPKVFTDLLCLVYELK